jgi:AcrR family transcriptional regulator
LKPTKQHIKDHALKLFNEKGFVNVRLQHIADAAFVSVGHLAYHFKNKDTIVAELYEDLKTRQQQLLNEYRVVPLFEDINAYLVSTYQLQSTYKFFYADTLEVLRAFPEIQKKHSEHLQWQMAQLKMMLRFNCARGSIIPLNQQQEQQLAWQMRSLIDMWLNIKRIEGATDLSLESFLRDIWGILLQLMTDMGNRELLQMNITT